MGSVWESWRVLQLLHAQSLVTLHQAAANTHTRTNRGVKEINETDPQRAEEMDRCLIIKREAE